MYPEYYNIPASELSIGTRVPFLVMQDSGEIHYEIAYQMFKEIEKNNALNRKTVMICPCGPINQYPIFARLVNDTKTSLKNTWIINMDEYITEEGELIDKSDPLSFRGYMQRYLYDRINPDIIMPEQQRIFPDPHQPEKIGQLIEKLGGVDLAIGGVAVNGHIAFNDPIPEMSNEEFRNLPTRVVTLSLTTRLKDAILNRGGAIDSLPERAVTIGMREILGAKKIRLTMMNNMQRAVIRCATHGRVTSSCPVTFIQEHPDAQLIVSENVTELPF